jgi:transposase
MGHEVKLMPGKFVKAFVMGNKNDAADARAIWMATQMTGKSVAVKTEAQQAVLALHRIREQKVKFRTAQVNSLRGLLTEYGEVTGKSRAVLDKAISGVLETLTERLPAMLIDSLREQWNGLAGTCCCCAVHLKASLWEASRPLPWRIWPKKSSPVVWDCQWGCM